MPSLHFQKQSSGIIVDNCMAERQNHPVLTTDQLNFDST